MKGKCSICGSWEEGVFKHGVSKVHTSCLRVLMNEVKKAREMTPADPDVVERHLLEIRERMAKHDDGHITDD